MQTVRDKVQRRMRKKKIICFKLVAQLYINYFYVMSFNLRIKKLYKYWKDYLINGSKF